MVSEPLRTGKVQQGVVLFFCFFGWSCCERAMRGHCVEHLKQSLGCSTNFKLLQIPELWDICQRLTTDLDRQNLTLDMEL